MGAAPSDSGPIEPDIDIAGGGANGIENCGALFAVLRLGNPGAKALGATFSPCQYLPLNMPPRSGD